MNMPNPDTDFYFWTESARPINPYPRFENKEAEPGSISDLLTVM